jgi:hypothetical protein
MLDVPAEIILDVSLRGSPGEPVLAVDGVEVHQCAYAQPTDQSILEAIAPSVGVEGSVLFGDRARRERRLAVKERQLAAQEQARVGVHDRNEPLHRQAVRRHQYAARLHDHIADRLEYLGEDWGPASQHAALMG